MNNKRQGNYPSNNGGNRLTRSKRNSPADGIKPMIPAKISFNKVTQKIERN